MGRRETNAPGRRGPLVRSGSGAAAAAVLLAAAGCGPRAPSRYDAVILITIDTVPADRIGCYGCPSVRTPVLDRLARRGVQVIDAIAPTPLTLPTHATLLTGLDPTEHGARENGIFVVADSLRTVPERLPPGTPAAAFVGAFPLAPRFGLAQGFDPYDARWGDGRGRRHAPERRASEVLDAAAQWMEGIATARRLFAWMHLYDAHHPYDPPPPWQRAAATLGGDGAYEGEVSYVDRELGRFLGRIEAAGRRPTVLLVADHGESLGRHGEISHGLFVYDATQRVPMIWTGPGIEPRLEREQRRLRDAAPTLLAAWSVETTDLPGVSLDVPAAAPHAWVETKHTELLRGWAPLYGIRTPEWKYVRAPRPELYDLEADPGETSNVIAEHPDVAERLSALVDEALAAEAGQAPRHLDERTAEQLRALGYVAAVTDPAQADLRKDPKDGVAGAAALFRGEDAYSRGDLIAAERHLLEAVRLDPTAKEAHSFLAGTYQTLGRSELAIVHARRSLELPPHLNEAPVHATLGEALLALGRAAEAVPHLRLARTGRRADPRIESLLAEAEAKAR